jgi:hypothetical protein
VPTPEAAPEAIPEAVGVSPVEEQPTGVATSGKREAFKAIARQLSQADVTNPGVVKMLIEELERAEAQIEVLEGFRDRFYDAERHASVLDEKLRKDTAFEVLVTSCFCLGGAGNWGGSAVLGCKY